MKSTRKIVRIEASKCDGCGVCVTSCAEGAIKIIDGKATLVSDSYCDGLGACLGECPQDAITIEEREADAFDVNAVHARLVHEKEKEKAAAAARPMHGGCPGMTALSFGGGQTKQSIAPSDLDSNPESSSELSQWPVQLRLVSPFAPYWNGSHLLVSADCVSVAYAGYQTDLLKGRKVVIACPKLDDAEGYIKKLSAIIAHNNIRSITVAHMEVPCCNGIVRMVEMALDGCGKSIPLRKVTVGVRGEIINFSGSDADVSSAE